MWQILIPDVTNIRFTHIKSEKTYGHYKFVMIQTLFEINFKIIENTPNDFLIHLSGN